VIPSPSDQFAANAEVSVNSIFVAHIQIPPGNIPFQYINYIFYDFSEKIQIKQYYTQTEVISYRNLLKKFGEYFPTYCG